MTANNQQFKDFEHTLTSETMQRGARYGKKKKSWVSLIIQVIVLILVTISGYSMFKEPIFNLVFVDKTVNFKELTNFQETINNLTNLNINVESIDNLQTSIDRLILVFYVFFIACILSLILTFFTLFFNKTILKIVNMFIIAIMLAITFGFSALIKNIATRIADSMNQYYITVDSAQILTESNAIHNAFILLSCSIALLLISLFFRNRKPRI
ncbi:hypothetical protein [Staphylococcus sp. GDH8C109P]|uniref:hypothetical protein n=1 Tax=Staphylococcus sp. GDH8C109P TaxID=2804088 RepID=UPI001AEC0B60|nr:hypothetical protein [Staphylococcus sp. GDH8C109P]